MPQTCPAVQCQCWSHSPALHEHPRPAWETLKIRHHRSIFLPGHVKHTRRTKFPETLRTGKSTHNSAVSDCLLLLFHLPITHLFHSATDLLSVPSLLPSVLLFLPSLSAFANGPSFAFLELTPALRSPLSFLQVLTPYSKTLLCLSSALCLPPFLFLFVATVLFHQMLLLCLLISALWLC